MIFTDRKITIRNGKSSINEPVILYRGDYEVSIKFTIMESKFRFKSGVNLVDSEKASHGQLAILAPYGGNVFSEVVKCEDGTVTFTLTKEMIDQLEEVGLYSFQIRLFDYYRESRVSIPPVEFGIEVREPVASEDHDNSINNAIVGYSIAKVVDGLNEDVPNTFDDNEQYNKTYWETGDRISEGKLNKIEDAIDRINQNEKNDVADLDKRITNNFNVLDANKADKTELDVERSRINNLTQLPSGSTSGDAELIDIRTDIFGVSNVNAGTAVRNQIQKLVDIIGLTNKHYGTHIINKTSTGALEVSSILGGDYKANTPIYLTFSGIGKASNLLVGCSYKNLGYRDGQVEVPLNETVEFIPPDDFRSFAVYMSGGDVGQYTFDVDSTMQGATTVRDLFDDVDDEIERIDNILGYQTSEVISEYTFSNVGNKSDIAFTNILVGDYEANTPIYIGYESNNGTSTTLMMGCHYANLGYMDGQVSIPLNTVVEFIPPDDFNRFETWHANASAGDFRITVYTAPPISKTIKEEIKDIKEEIKDIKDKPDNEGYNIKSGSFSIVGDSWSTFKNWVPNNNAIWYPPEEGTGGNGTGNDVASVRQTWWWQLADRTGMTLYLNDSWSGSTICGTGYGGSNALATNAMVTRVKTHMGETNVLGPKPNIIFILAGTNDSYGDSPIGVVQYSSWTESDLMATLPAFCCMIDYLQTWNPGCRIINVVNPNIKSEIQNGFVTACEHYGVENLILRDISLTGSHPNSDGMKAIADQIIAIL